MMEKPFNAKTMEIVHKYIDKLCKRMNESAKEVEEFREEMTTNLVSSINNWVSRGYTESEALDKALVNFGESSQIEIELKQLYRIKKIFSGSILKAAIALFLLGALIVGWFFMWNEILHYNVAKKTFDIVKQEMGTTEKPISNEMREKLEKSIAGSLSITSVVLRIQEERSKAPQEYPVSYHYPESLKLDIFNNIPFKENLFTYISGTGTSVSIPDTNKAVSIDLGLKLFSNVTFMVGVTLLFGYWVLFAIWASMDVYYRGSWKSSLGTFVLVAQRIRIRALHFCS